MSKNYSLHKEIAHIKYELAKLDEDMKNEVEQLDSVMYLLHTRQQTLQEVLHRIYKTHLAENNVIDFTAHKSRQ